MPRRNDGSTRTATHSIEMIEAREGDRSGSGTAQSMRAHPFVPRRLGFHSTQRNTTPRSPPLVNSAQSPSALGNRRQERGRVAARGACMLAWRGVGAAQVPIKMGTVASELCFPPDYCHGRLYRVCASFRPHCFCVAWQSVDVRVFGVTSSAARH